MKRPRCSLWLKAPHDRELRFWNTLGAMAAADAAQYERDGDKINARQSWNRARPHAGDIRTKELCDARIAANV